MAVKNRLDSMIRRRSAEIDKSITISDIAGYVGVSEQAIYKWRNDQVRAFRRDTLEKICEFLNCEIGELLYIDKSEKAADEHQPEMSGGD